VALRSLGAEIHIGRSVRCPAASSISASGWTSAIASRARTSPRTPAPMTARPPRADDQSLRWSHLTAATSHPQVPNFLLAITIHELFHTPQAVPRARGRPPGRSDRSQAGRLTLAPFCPVSICGALSLEERHRNRVEAAGSQAEPL